VVNNGGNLIALERLEGKFSAGPGISFGKARLPFFPKSQPKFSKI
jgi:uncharacterized protein GlcG (DUF336 family)